MTAALLSSEALPPEAIELIRAGTPKPRVASTVLEVTAPAAPSTPAAKEETAAPSSETAVPSLPEAPAAGDAATAVGGETKPAKTKPPRDREPEPMASNALVSMTFRVPTEMPSALVRASADRKARRVRPYTQQEIVAEALAQWLKRNGY